MKRPNLIVVVGIIATLVFTTGCNDYKKVPISEDIQKKRDKVMPDGKIPDPRTAQQRLKENQ
jgi:hypothetical protein